MTETKRCRTCGEVKPLDEFYIDRGNSTGRTSRCRACTNAVQKSAYRSRSRAGTKLNNYSELRGTRRRSVCGILNAHHEILKDDPDRLSSDFLKSLIGGVASECEESE